MIQAFTDLVGTSAVPALSINIDELTELTPALDTAAIDHGLSVEASDHQGSFVTAFASPFCH
jgi:hypothetical protein